MGEVLTTVRRARCSVLCASVLGALVLGLGACDDLRVTVVVFNTLDDARAGGAISAGWIPDGLPPSVTELRAAQLPDGRHWGVFTFPRSGEAAVHAIVADEITTGTVHCDPPGRLDWWPQLVQSTVDVQAIRATGFRVYSGAGRTWVINWGQGRAYYWK